MTWNRYSLVDLGDCEQEVWRRDVLAQHGEMRHVEKDVDPKVAYCF